MEVYGWVRKEGGDSRNEDVASRVQDERRRSRNGLVRMRKRAAGPRSIRFRLFNKLLRIEFDGRSARRKKRTKKHFRVFSLTYLTSRCSFPSLPFPHFRVFSLHTSPNR
ncbi:hypothetical protein B0H12DRAFT_202721 [Mycena haematopus]|nr:hypothetical protein B0H12DRAFT_202721 [Mycena haematopus]